ncbi:HAMP domain-containing sensor histidine kinase [Sporosarcina sp. P33]|uniref:sensor histidine kinase n=1 Tax=Sporosarcina sp. P33 TaxID=1930764 RepID=UPI0009C3B0D2|nr:HAMP domain-containing sensor histidine kinase [Sporosarcina sp. P33]ARD48561.1 hypothetical protein SporoP33_10275 [Sporosarcina sp. P33]
MNKQIKLAVWSALVTLVLIALPSVIHYAPQLVGKSFTDQRDFKYRVQQTYDNLSAAVLNPLDLEKAEKELRVFPGEIAEHRERYGTLTEQLDNIQQQYADRITEAKDSENETLLLALVKERNMKIDDIQKNFESDSYVEDKIRSEKAANLARFIKETKNNLDMNLPISYDLVNTETGERFTKGNIEKAALYREVFDDARGYFKADSAVYDNGYSDYSMDEETSFDGEASISNPPEYFKGTIIIPSDAATIGALAQENDAFIRGKYMLYALWIAGALALAALLTVIKFRKEWVLNVRFSAVYARWKVDVRIALVLLTGFVLAIYIQSAVYRVLNQFTYLTLGAAGNMVVSFFLFGVLLTALLAFQTVHVVELYKKTSQWENAWRESFALQFVRDVKGLFDNRTIGVQLLVLLVIFFLAGIGFAGALYDSALMLIYVFCVLFVALPALFLLVKKAAYLNRILAATNDMAAGHLTQEIPVRGKSPLAKHAANLNNLREGVRVSINEQAKSERLKTELITNVSHDLRTPLTSIITYTDLLKDETLSAEERAKYVGILDQKSQRLKTLIEDLFEVSKMASGNLEMVKQRVDLNQLMQQALAEHAEEFTERDLHVRAALPEAPVFAQVDGQKWWRVLDNLLINVWKYALPGTRVYLNLQQIGPNARIILKNVAKYELGDNTDELFERFKRGDESRQTEGSGLGLAIAQSIVELHGGKMEVEVDGDLFKVVIDIAGD